MRHDRGIGEADAAQDIFADLPLELGGGRIIERGQRRKLRRRQGADRVMGEPEEIARACRARLRIADGNGLFQQNRRKSAR